MNAIDMLLAVAGAFASARQLSESRVSTLVFGEGTRLKHLRAGGDMGARRVARGVEWFAANWPDDAEWPAQITRPQPKQPTPVSPVQPLHDAGEPSSAACTAPHGNRARHSTEVAR